MFPGFDLHDPSGYLGGGQTQGLPQTSSTLNQPQPHTSGDWVAGQPIEDEFKKEIEEYGISEEVLMNTTIKDLNKMLKVMGCTSFHFLTFQTLRPRDYRRISYRL